MRLAMLFPVGLLFGFTVGPDCAVAAGDPKDVLLTSATTDPDEQVRGRPPRPWKASKPRRGGL